MAEAEHERIGRLLRSIRRQSGQRQIDLSRAAKIPRRDVILIETGRAGAIRLDRVQRAFAAAGGRARVAVWWNGAAADRLLDARHAALVEAALSAFRRNGWDPQVEVTFSEFGERGSMDILASHAQTRTVAVCEVKSALGSLEETNRTLDAKVRLAPGVALERFGWRPRFVGRLLILPAENTARRQVARHALTMASVYPARTREVREWLRRPEGPLRAVWFVSEVRNRDSIER